jgi:bilirubin oxidase
MMDRRVFVASTSSVLLGASIPWLGHPVSRQRGDRQVKIDLVAAPRRAELVAGKPCTTFAYNGRIPGPVLEVREGDEVRVRFRNDLDEDTTVHWHGMHIPFDADGSPFHPVAPGASYDYRFEIPRGSAGTYWYHPHPQHRTGYQVALGLHGALIVRADDDPLAHLPEQLLVLWDNRVDEEGSIDVPGIRTMPGRIDFENGREGPLHFVNGELGGRLDIRSGEVQRWRIVNASAARFYRLALEGHALVHVGSDGGLFEVPREVDELMLAPSERAEVLVRATATPGTRARLLSLPYDRYIPQTRPADWTEPCQLLTLEYADAPPVPSPPIPSRLRLVPPLHEADATATRIMALSQGMINGKLMDHDRVDVTAPLGATEIWQVENLVGMDHPFHLHGFQFQVLDRNGVPEPFRCWKDTVNVPKHEMLRFIVRYDDFPGKWMFHCHILDHEDHGMMGVLEVR